MQTKHPELKTTEGSPRRQIFGSASDSAEVAAAGKREHATAADGLLPDEHVCTRCSQYLWRSLAFSKRIDEKRSSNKRGPNGNRWFYPDVVGMEDLGAVAPRSARLRDAVFRQAHQAVVVRGQAADQPFERARVLFQAVSNSSWANFGYLVAAEIGGTDTLKELRMLFAATVSASSSWTWKTLPTVRC